MVNHTITHTKPWLTDKIRIVGILWASFEFSQMYYYAHIFDFHSFYVSLSITFAYKLSERLAAVPKLHNDDKWCV